MWEGKLYCKRRRMGLIYVSVIGIITDINY